MHSASPRGLRGESAAGSHLPYSLGISYLRPPGPRHRFRSSSRNTPCARGNNSGTDSDPRRLAATRWTLLPAGLDEPRLVGDHHKANAVARIQLRHDAGDVRLGGERAEVQPLADLGVGQAVADQREDFALALGEPGE